MLLPTKSGEGDAFPNHLLRHTREEIVRQFGGITAYTRSPAAGEWMSPDGSVAQDDVVMIEVVADAFDRPWWRDYADLLKERFSQESIHIRATSVEILDE
jgi:hypothetical protein